jgi:hypothetical protein
VSALDDAREEVERKAQTSLDPVLTPDEVEAILAGHLRYATWAAETAYAFGDVVVPATRTGQKFRAVQGGTSGATPPFSTTGTYNPFTRISDGSTLVWEEDGRDFGSPYDIRGAVHAAWELKAAKASDRIQFSADGGSFHEQQTLETCLKMVQRYAPVGVA